MSAEGGLLKGGGRPVKLVVSRRDEREWRLQRCSCQEQYKLANPGIAQPPSTPISGRERTSISRTHFPTLLFP